ncbi:hypothetical protein [Streptomyces europaeiscabiei]|uniref:hypothetical protein n=1 Tax=Streptomyces europaeiscabiei TaxID=146819 RepID=UPI0029BECD44|nr:hypothetical protein [Streptomyces europaeiscabiei]MDX3834343.1 hypothetical protein [Streptomyces europaeiscabiei]
MLIDTADARTGGSGGPGRGRGGRTRLDPEAVWVATQGRLRADILPLVAPERDPGGNTAPWTG